jgi:GntR family transcriptional regulator, rspAB operon transcriptional repressor
MGVGTLDGMAMTAFLPGDVRAGESAATRIERELRGAIIDLTIRPGERLSEAEIAERYQVSRQPVREAFIGLARAGLVRVEPQRGTLVMKLSIRRMLDARFIREALELAIMRRACAHFEPHYLQTAHLLIEEQALAAEAGDHTTFRRLDAMFHAAMAEGAGCLAAWRVIEAEKAHMDRVCTLTLHSAETMRPLVGQHRAILDAVIARDAPAAMAAVQTHLSEILAQAAGVESANAAIFEDMR